MTDPVWIDGDFELSDDHIDETVTDIIDQIESQRLNPSRHPPTGVGEAQAVYCIERESSRVH